MMRSLEMKAGVPVEVAVRVLKPIEVEWKCPNCHENETSFKWSLPAKFPVQCNKCGKTYLGVR